MSWTIVFAAVSLCLGLPNFATAGFFDPHSTAAASVGLAAPTKAGASG